MDEVCMVYRYHLRRSEDNANFTTSMAASELRKMSTKELYECEIQNIVDALEQEDFTKDYAVYARQLIK